MLAWALLSLFMEEIFLPPPGCSLSVDFFMGQLSWSQFCAPSALCQCLFEISTVAVDKGVCACACCCLCSPWGLFLVGAYSLSRTCSGSGSQGFSFSAVGAGRAEPHSSSSKSSLQDPGWDMTDTSKTDMTKLCHMQLFHVSYAAWQFNDCHYEATQMQALPYMWKSHV